MSGRARSMARAGKRRQAAAESKNGVIAVTLQQLLNSIPQMETPHIPGALSVLISQPIPITVSFRLGKIVRAVNAELEEFQAQRTKLLERFANKDGAGKPIMLDAKGKRIVASAEGEPQAPGGDYDIPSDKQAEYKKEVGDLAAVQVEIPGQQIKISDLGDIKMAAGHMMQLEWLIIDDKS